MADKKKNRLSEIIMDALAQAVQDVPAQLEDALSLAPRAYNALNLRNPQTGKSLGYEIPTAPFKSKLATETLPYLAEEVMKPRKITGEEGVSGDLSLADVGIIGALGATGLRSAVQGIQHNARMDTAIKELNKRQVVMDNISNFKSGMSTVPEGATISKRIDKLPIDQQAEVIIQQSQRSPTLKTALDKFVELEKNIPKVKAELVGQRGSLIIPPETGAGAKAVGETAANVGKQLANKPIVPVSAIIQPTGEGKVKGLKIEPIAQEAIANTQGAKITPEGIELDISRYQKKEQFGSQAIRTGVFYLPENKSPYGKYYSTGKEGYGGGEKITGRTTYRNPIIVKAGTGGKGVEKAYDQVEGKGAYQKMRSDVLENAWTKDFNRRPDENAISALLEKYGGNPDLAYEIIRTSKTGNLLPYAIQEHIAAHALRKAGYDAVISHSISGGRPRLAEVFDLRAEEYPSELSDYKYEDFYPKLSQPTGEGKVEGLELSKLINNPSRLSMDERLNLPQSQVKKAEKEGELLLKRIKEGGANKADIFFRSTHKEDFSERADAGIFFANDFGTSKHYAGNLFKTEPSKMQVAKLDIKNPYYATKDEIEYHAGKRQEWVKKLKSEGYDAIVEKASDNPNDMGYDVIPTEVAVFDKSQVRKIAVIDNPEGRNLSDKDLYERIKSKLHSKMRLDEKGSAMATGPEIRKFIETVRNSVTTDPVLRTIIDSRYIPKSNKVTLAEADTIINNNYDLAYAMVMDPGKPSAVSNTIAMRLISQAQGKRNFEEAKRLVEITAERNTAAGQAIQALAMYGKLSPEGVTSYASGVVNRARAGMREAKIKEFEKAITGFTDDDARAAIARKMNIPYISAKQLEEIYNDSLAIQKMPEGRDRMVATALMLKKIAANVDSGSLSKISMLQTLAQLVNPKTVVRNILGNFVFATTENVAQTFATGLDVMASLITKQRTTTLPNLKAQTYGFYKGAREGLEEALLGINTRQLNTKFSLPRNGVFHKGVLGGLEKVLGVILQAPDRAFFEQAYVDSLSGQMKLTKTTDPTPEMMEQATLDGLYKTFQDRSLACRALTGFKKAMNVGKEWGVGDMVIKYPATPGNIWARGFEYTPGGFVKSMYYLGRLIKEHEKTRDQREFVRSMARALTGSSLLFGTAAALATLGIISGKRDPDRDVSATKRMVGLKSYQINISALKRFIFSGMDPSVAKPEPNDTLVSYDWMLPASIPMVVGANIVEESKRRSAKEVPQPGQAVAEGMAEAANSMVDQPMLSGMSQLRKSQDIYSWLTGMVTDIPASFVPTFSSQLTKLTDNIVRNTNDPNYFKQAYNKVIAKVPIASKSLTEQLNTLGQPMKSYQGESNSPFNVLLNPAFINKYKPTPETKMVLDIWEATGEGGVFPRVAPKTLTVGGRTVHLKPEMQKDYQEYIGNKTGVLFNILVNDPKFMAMPDELKAQKLQNYLTDINTSAKIELFGLYPKKTVRGQQVPYIPKRTQSILSLP